MKQNHKLLRLIENPKVYRKPYGSPKKRFLRVIGANVALSLPVWSDRF